MLAEFLADAPKQLAEVDRALGAGDAAAAHTLKTSAAYLGAAELSVTCARIEALVKEGTLAAAGGLAAAARSELGRVAAILASAR